VNDQDVSRLEAEARYARERYQLYRARSFGSKPADPGRMRDLERSHQRAATRLRRARTVPEHN
jgi:hypothetical protein